MLHANQASKQSTAVDRATDLSDEEVSDVSLATFYVFEAENPAALPRGRRAVAGGCGCSVGCGGCGRGCGS
jgi:hypothetical protein